MLMHILKWLQVFNFVHISLSSGHSQIQMQFVAFVKNGWQAGPLLRYQVTKLAF